MSKERHIPLVYRNLIPNSIQDFLPNEGLSSCDNCSMIKSHSENGSKGFLPHLKCCTHHPSLPNFLVGAILADKSDEMSFGRSKIIEKLRKKEGVTPLGIMPSKKISELSKIYLL